MGDIKTVLDEIDIEENQEKILEYAKKKKVPIERISDGYHEFRELYEHRMALFVALTKANALNAWRSKLHSDGTMYEGYFVVGINKKSGEQISYHYEIKHWDKFDHCYTAENAPEFDGHTPEGVVERLLKL